MTNFFNQFSGGTTLGTVTMILALVFAICAIAFTLLSLKVESRVFKIIASIVLPVLAITCTFALLFIRLGALSGVLSYFVGFGIAVLCEALSFVLAYAFNGKKI